MTPSHRDNRSTAQPHGRRPCAPPPSGPRLALRIAGLALGLMGLSAAPLAAENPWNPYGASAASALPALQQPVPTAPAAPSAQEAKPKYYQEPATAAPAPIGSRDRYAPPDLDQRLSAGLPPSTPYSSTGSQAGAFAPPAGGFGAAAGQPPSAYPGSLPATGYGTGGDPAAPAPYGAYPGLDPLYPGIGMLPPVGTYGYPGIYGGLPPYGGYPATSLWPGLTTRPFGWW